MRVHDVSRAVSVLQTLAPQQQMIQEAERKELKVIGMHELRQAFALNIAERNVGVMSLEERRRLVETLPSVELEDYVEYRRMERPIQTEKMREVKHVTERAEVTFEQELERLRLVPQAFIRLELEPDSLLESWYWRNLRKEVEQAIDNVIDASIKRSMFIKALNVSEAIQAMINQLYAPRYMEMPATHNMFGVRVTPLTYQRLKGKHVSYYMSANMPSQDIKTIQLVAPAEDRVTQTKVIAELVKPLQIPHSGSTTVQTTHEVGESNEADLKDVLGVWRLTWRQWLKIPEEKRNEILSLYWQFWVQPPPKPEVEPVGLISLFSVMGRSYIIGHWLFTHVGYPEIQYEVRKPHIAVIVTRHGVKVRTWRGLTMDRWVQMHRDYYLKMMMEWKGRHG